MCNDSYQHINIGKGHSNEGFTFKTEFEQIYDKLLESCFTHKSVYKINLNNFFVAGQPHVEVSIEEPLGDLTILLS